MPKASKNMFSVNGKIEKTYFNKECEDIKNPKKKRTRKMTKSNKENFKVSRKSIFIGAFLKYLKASNKKHSKKAQ